MLVLHIFCCADNQICHEMHIIGFALILVSVNVTKCSLACSSPELLLCLGRQPVNLQDQVKEFLGFEPHQTISKWLGDCQLMICPPPPPSPASSSDRTTLD